MNKANIVFILSQLISNLVFAQDWQKEFDRKVIENNTLKIQLDEKQKELEKLRDEKAVLEKNTAQSGNFKSEYDRLIVENTQVLTEKNGLLTENTGLKEDLKKTNADLRQVRFENKDLTVEKETLKAEKKALTDENNQLKSERQGLVSGSSQLKSEKQSLLDENAKFKAQIEALTASNDKLAKNQQLLTAENTQLKTDKQNLSVDYTKLKDYSQAQSEENKQVKAGNQRLSEENARLRQEKQNPNLENSSLNELLAEAFKSTVNYTVNSNQYDLKKTKELSAKFNCASAFFKANEGDSLLTKLNQYKQLCNILEEVQTVLNKPYDKASCDRVSNLLTNCPAFNKVQLSDIAASQKLIQEYCAKSDYCAKHLVTVKKYQGNYPDDAKKEVDNTLNNIDPKYSYLIRELNAKKQNLTGYVCNFPTNCN